MTFNFYYGFCRDGGTAGWSGNTEQVCTQVKSGDFESFITGGFKIIDGTNGEISVKRKAMYLVAYCSDRNCELVHYCPSFEVRTAKLC